MSLQFVTFRHLSLRFIRRMCGIAGLYLMINSQAWVHGQENLFQGLSTDNTPQVDNPWGGVSNGVLTVLPGFQKAVNDAGSIVLSNPGPSIAVGDLNGDGLPDLVVADSKGFFWYYPNSGTPTQPKFTYGEVMPIWFSNPNVADPKNPDWIYRQDESEDNTVPRIQLVDFDKDGKLDLVVGNYEGKLYYLRNTGSTHLPVFAMPKDLDALLIPTYSHNLLWCNFLAPFLYDWRGVGVLDLLMGEGTYASNSIYLLKNKGSSAQPIFNEENTTKIIPGLGREHLQPQVVDWNNDGKPDILTGERLGYISVFLNTSTDALHPQFDQGQHIKFGGSETFGKGQFATASVADLTGNKLPNLVLSDTTNQLFYAENKGTPGNPQFNAPLPLKGTNPFPKTFQAPVNWTNHGVIWKALGIPYALLCVGNAQTDPDVKLPTPDIKSYLKYYTVPHQNKYFPVGFYPEEDTQMIRYVVGNSGNPVIMKPKTTYKLSFWIRETGDISNFIYRFESDQPGTGGNHYNIKIENQISVSESWSQYSENISYSLHPEGVQVPSLNFGFFFGFNGRPTLNIADIELKEQP